MYLYVNWIKFISIMPLLYSLSLSSFLPLAPYPPNSSSPQRSLVTFFVAFASHPPPHPHILMI